MENLAKINPPSARAAAFNLQHHRCIYAVRNKTRMCGESVVPGQLFCETHVIAQQDRYMEHLNQLKEDQAVDVPKVANASC